MPSWEDLRHGEGLITGGSQINVAYTFTLGEYIFKTNVLLLSALDGAEERLRPSQLA
jgi:hypothetical protein